MLLAVKTKNAITKAAGHMPLRFSIRNISVNGNKRGCSGFVENLETGSCVYLNTEIIPMLGEKVMYRYAKDTKDYSSTRIKNGNNNWCKPDELGECVVKLLKDGKAIER